MSWENRTPNARTDRVDTGSVTDDKWLTRPEVAARFRVPVGTVADWASKGTGPPYAKFGKHTRYRLSDVIGWENEQMSTHTA